MHLVFLNQYYPPDAAPTGVMLEAVVEELARQGHTVTVLCAAGGYAGGDEVISEQLSVISGVSGGDDRDMGSSQSSPIASHPSPCVPRIIRIGATSFGRGTFVGKLLDYAFYYLGVAWKLTTLRSGPDRIVALTTPPLLSVLARGMSRLRGGDHAHWVMDLYPDVMAAHGMLGEKNAVYRILKRLARWGFGGRRCAAVLTLGPDMAERVKKVMSDQSSVIRKGGGDEGEDLAGLSTQPSTLNSQRVLWVPLWGGEKVRDPEMPISNYQPSTLNVPLPFPLRRQRGWADDEVIVMYSGNMGLGHRFEEILAAAERVNIEHRTPNIEQRSEEVADPMASSREMIERRNESCGPETQADCSNHQRSTLISQLFPSYRFVFFGGGKRRGEVAAFLDAHPGAAVELHDYAPAGMLMEHLQSADVHFVSLEDSWTGTMVPSKLQGIFAAGRPVIFMGSAESSIGCWVAESGGGWVVGQGDVAGLRAALAEAASRPTREARGRAALAFAQQHFDKRTNVARVAEILTRERPLR